MSNFIVGISDQKICKKPDTLITYALGSCVGICLLDKDIGLAGMAHIMLPDSNIIIDGTEINKFKFADTGIVELFNTMVRRGARVGCITAKIAGGAMMFSVSCNKFNIGERNVVAVKETLRKLHIPIIAEDTGSNYGRTICFNAENGMLEVKSNLKGNKTI